MSRLCFGNDADRLMDALHDFKRAVAECVGSYLDFVRLTGGLPFRKPPRRRRSIRYRNKRRGPNRKMRKMQKLSQRYWQSASVTFGHMHDKRRPEVLLNPELGAGDVDIGQHST